MSALRRGRIARAGRVGAVAVLALVAGARAARAQDDTPAVIVEAVAHLTAGRPLRALERLDKGRAEVPESLRSDWHELRGASLQRLGRDADALAAFDQAIALQPGCVSRLFRAVVHLRAGRIAEARADYAACEDVRTGVVDPRRAGGIRLAIDGPYRERWPHAWPKLEARSAEGHYHIVSLVGTTAAAMDALEREASLLDPAVPADKRRLDALLAPAQPVRNIASVMEAIRREVLGAFGLAEKDWPRGRICRVFVIESEEEVNRLGTALGFEAGGSWFDSEGSFVATGNTALPATPLGIGERTVRLLVDDGVDQILSAYGVTLPWWLDSGVGNYFAAHRVVVKGKEVRMEMGLLVRENPDRRETRFACVRRLVETNSTMPWLRLFRMTDEQWNAGATWEIASQAWAVCFYLFNARNDEFRRRFVALLRDLRGGEDWWTVLPKHLPDDVLNAFEVHWLEYWRKL